jgi:hypothetical protein
VGREAVVAGEDEVYLDMKMRMRRREGSGGGKVAR